MSRYLGLERRYVLRHEMPKVSRLMGMAWCDITILQVSTLEERRDLRGMIEIASQFSTLGNRRSQWRPITSDKARFQMFAKCPIGRPDSADQILLIGVVQGHGLDKEIEEKHPWIVE